MYIIAMIAMIAIIAIVAIIATKKEFNKAATRSVLGRSKFHGVVNGKSHNGSVSNSNTNTNTINHTNVNSDSNTTIDSLTIVATTCISKYNLKHTY